jgi:hypothetical protein
MINKALFIFLIITLELFYLHLFSTQGLLPFLYWIFAYLFFVDIETRRKYFILIPSLFVMDFVFDFYLGFHLLIFLVLLFGSFFIDAKSVKSNYKINYAVFVSFSLIFSIYYIHVYNIKELLIRLAMTVAFFPMVCYFYRWQQDKKGVAVNL